MKAGLHYQRTTIVRYLMQVIWPAFLAAVVTCGLVFSALDPEELPLFGRQNFIADEAAYTIGFILIWVQYSAACTITWWLTTHDAERVAYRQQKSVDKAI